MNISKGVQPSPQKVVLYGPEGIGKSTFGARFPAPLFIDVEASTKHLNVVRITPAPATWSALLDTVKDLLAERPAEFQTVVLDTADWAEQMCVKHVCEKHSKAGVEDFGYGKGYTYVAEEFSHLLNYLEDVIDAGYNVVILAHAKMRKFEQPDEMGAYDRWEMKLSRQVAPMVKEWADMVLFANYKSMVITIGEWKNAKHKAQGQGRRVLYTTHHSCWDAKNRHNLPDELSLDYGQIAKCIQQPLAVNVEPPAPAASDQPSPVDLEEGIMAFACGFASPDTPAELAELMERDKILDAEVRAVIGKTGHFPADTPWETLQAQGYVTGYIIPNWGYFVEQINADPNRLPF